MVHATLKFDRQQLLYDVENMAFVEGDIMRTQDEHEKHQVIDVGQDGNVDRMTRVFDICHAKCVEMLYPLSRHDVHVSAEGSPWKNELKERPEYRIDLILPHNFSQSTVNLIKELVHEYMVCKAIADWMSITKPDKAEAWEAKAENAAAELRKAKAHRIGRRRRGMSPF